MSMISNNKKRPEIRGNAWQVTHEDDVIRYLSDQFDGRLMPFEERDKVSLAETPGVALVGLAIGHGANVERPFDRSFPWHITDPVLEKFGTVAAAESQSIIDLSLDDKERLCLRTHIAITIGQAGIVENEALPTKSVYKRAIEGVKQATQTMLAWSKTVYVTHMSLSLMAGRQTPSEVAADYHYAAVIQELRGDITLTTGQTSFPLAVVSQSGGTRRDGTSEVILAEGRLDIQHPTLDVIVATPKYPFALLEDMPATHSGEAHRCIDELEVLAIREVHAGRRWHCPSMETGVVQDDRVVLTFSTMSDLVLNPGNHGFDVFHNGRKVQVLHAGVAGNTVILTLERHFKRDITVHYAWGRTGDAQDGYCANRGSLRDSFEVQSTIDPETTLHRYALSGRVHIQQRTQDA